MPVASSPIVHNLHERALRFCGFSSQGRAVLQRLANGDRQPVYSIEGLGASGKTALALELAWNIVENRRVFPHHVVVWVPARTPALVPPERTSLRAAPEQHTLARICHTLGSILDDASLLSIALVPDPTRHLAALQSALRAQSVLLFIDEIEQVHRDETDLFHQLLRTLPLPSHAIVTARRYHGFPYPTRLIGLDEQEMSAFIARECREADIALDPSQQRIVRAWAHGLPYAVRVALSRIQQAGVDRALSEMAHGPASLVRPVLGRLPQTLRTEHPFAFAGLLRLARRDIERGMMRGEAITVLDPDFEVGTELLQPLMAANLVVCTQINGPERLSIPPLALWYLRSRLWRATRELQKRELQQ